MNDMSTPVKTKRAQELTFIALSHIHDVHLFVIFTCYYITHELITQYDAL